MGLHALGIPYLAAVEAGFLAGRRRRNSAVGGWETHKLKKHKLGCWGLAALRIRGNEEDAPVVWQALCVKLVISSPSARVLCVDAVLSRTCVPYGRGNAAHERDRSGQFSHSFGCNIVLAIRFFFFAAPRSLCAGDAGNLPHVCWQKTLRHCLLGWLVA
jgi:hypothetical protein